MPFYRSIVIGDGTKGESRKAEGNIRQRSSGLGESRKNRWPSAPMGGLAFRTRNSPSQKTSLRWGDCCPPNPNPPSSSALWKDRQRDMPPVPVWGCPPLLRDCTPRGLQRYRNNFLLLHISFLPISLYYLKRSTTRERDIDFIRTVREPLEISFLLFLRRLNTCHSFCVNLK